MTIVQNFPCISIVGCMFCGIVSSVLKGKSARRLNAIWLVCVLVMSVMILSFCIRSGSSYVYVMGRFPAPWGNELRIGVLEALMAVFFTVVMLLSLMGGREQLLVDVDEEKLNLYFIMVDLLMASLLALIYTNDLFTAYVFVEINTISACGLIMIRQNGHTLLAATKYMIMSLLGSGLILISLCMLYDMTGHLLMSNICEQVQELAANGDYRIPLLVTIGFLCVGLAIKSALFPFHAWLPDAYGYSTLSSQAILSSLVSKGYIFLLIKIIYRVVGFDVFVDSHVIDILFVFGLAGMIFGSLSAIREHDIRRMIAFSSVAQIGYIYMGFGLGSTAAMVASIFHILSHAATKSLLFISGAGLVNASGGETEFEPLTGAGYRAPLAGIAFTVGALSMVGFPGLSGFISKLLFAQAAVLTGKNVRMLLAVVVLAISTILNAIYFMKTVIRIYTPLRGTGVQNVRMPKVNKELYWYMAALLCMILLNLFLGLWAKPLEDWITLGLSMFGA
jgi:multicomponent Na+:H+ antiporter subunit D